MQFLLDYAANFFETLVQAFRASSSFSLIEQRLLSVHQNLGLKLPQGVGVLEGREREIIP